MDMIILMVILVIFIIIFVVFYVDKYIDNQRDNVSFYVNEDTEEVKDTKELYNVEIKCNLYYWEEKKLEDTIIGYYKFFATKQFTIKVLAINDEDAIEKAKKEVRKTYIKAYIKFYDCVAEQNDIIKTIKHKSEKFITTKELRVKARIGAKKLGNYLCKKNSNYNLAEIEKIEEKTGNEYDTAIDVKARFKIDYSVFKNDVIKALTDLKRVK